MRAIAPLLLAAACVAHAAESPIPQRLPIESYDKLVEDWPFALATPAEKPKDPENPVFQGLYLGSAAKLSEGGVDKDWVVIRDQADAGRIIQLFGTEPNDDGFKLDKVTWADDPKNIKATVSKGGETKELETDQGAWRTTGLPTVQPTGTRPAVNGRPAVPVIPLPNGGNAIRPPGATGTPQPRGQMIPRPGGAPAPQAIKVNPAQGATPIPRTRVIPSPK